MKNETLSTSEIILAIASMPKLARSLSGKGRKYDELLDEMLKYDYYAEDSHLPGSKELQAKTGLNAQKCKKQVVEIYNDFLAAMGSENSFYESNNFKYEFYVHFRNKSKYFYARLPVAPRLGEVMELNFMRPIFGFTIFYVERIAHIMKDDCQVIAVWLKGGEGNDYEKFLIDKAKYEGRYDYINAKII